MSGFKQFPRVYAGSDFGAPGKTLVVGPGEDWFLVQFMGHKGWAGNGVPWKYYPMTVYYIRKKDDGGIRRDHRQVMHGGRLTGRSLPDVLRAVGMTHSQLGRACRVILDEKRTFECDKDLSDVTE